MCESGVIESVDAEKMYSLQVNRVFAGQLSVELSGLFSYRFFGAPVNLATSCGIWICNYLQKC